MENNFTKVHTSMDFIISGVIIAAGIGLFFISMATGIVVALCGILLLICYKSGYKYGNKDIVLKHKQLEVSKKYQKNVLDFLNGDATDLEMQPGNESGTLLLEVWCNTQASVAYAQLHDYLELRFQPITGIIELPTEKVQKVIEKS